MIRKLNLSSIITDQEYAENDYYSFQNKENQFDPKHYDMSDPEDKKDYEEMLKEKEQSIKERLKPVGCENIEWTNKLAIVQFVDQDFFLKYYAAEFNIKTTDKKLHFYVIGEAFQGHLLIGPVGFSGPNVIVHDDEIELVPPITI